MVSIMNVFAEKFGNHAILKGGMELRLLDCPRFTNDLDYVFVPYTSKNEIKDVIQTALQDIPQMHVARSIHSACIRYIVSREATRVQVEVDVAVSCKSEALTTGALATSRNLQPRMIRVMSLDCALAHKLAAWNERRLIRDLYDASFMSNSLGVVLDMETLRQRLTSIRHRYNKHSQKKMSLTEFATALETTINSLEQKAVETEIGDFFEPMQLPGLYMKIRAGIVHIISFLRNSG